MSLRVVFFGNSESAFSNRHYAALRQARARIVGVVDVPPAKRVSTNTARSGVSFVSHARSRGIPAFEPISPNTPEFVACLRELLPDLLIAVGYMNLLKADILAVPRLLAANFHASLLPAYRGKHPVFWALRHGERQAGLTVHVMDQHLDTGDILYQVRVRTRREDSVTSLYDRIMERSVQLVRRLLSDAEAGSLERLPQPSAGASYFSSPTEQDFHIDWSLPAGTLRRWIWLSPGACFTEIAGRRVHFVDSQACPVRSRPGTVVRLGRSSVVIAAGQDALRVTRLVLNGVERPAATLIRELLLAEGDNLRTGEAMDAAGRV